MTALKDEGKRGVYNLTFNVESLRIKQAAQ